MKAIIVGGGIGGLTTALMLRARGIDCELFEQSDTIRELGVGINTLPHAIRELTGLGLLDRLDAAAVRTDQLYYLNRHGQEVWREPRDWPAFLTGRSMIVAGGLNAKVVVYPIAEGSSPASRLTNWAVLVKIGEGNSPPPRREDWSRPGKREELMPHVERFSVPHVDVRSLISATPEFYEYPCCDRDPLPYWTWGRVTLLGDAAHPMYPVGSNGASQAILDARALADSLAHAEHPRQALLAYEQKRLPMTAEIVRSNRRGGPEGVIDAVEQLAPDGFDNVENVLSYSQREAIVRGYASKAGFAAVPGLAAVRA